MLFREAHARAAGGGGERVRGAQQVSGEIFGRTSKRRNGTVFVCSSMVLVRIWGVRSAGS